MPKPDTMQNPLSVPPRDQGDVPRFSAPTEKRLAQEMESPRKTACTGEPNVPSGTAQSRKGLQSKSQFRSIAPKIAPKIVPKVLPPRVLPCTPSLPDRGQPGAPVTPKPLGIPAQNYALMQVAGHKGTFSLIALPQVASAQPIPKPRLPPPENLKVPIPRYQPPRSSRATSQTPVLSPPESSKRPPQPQSAPAPAEPPEPPCKPEPTGQVPCVTQAPAGTSTARRGGPGEPPSPVASEPGAPVSSVPRELSARQGLRKTSRKATLGGKQAPSKPAADTSPKLQEQMELGRAVSVVPPAILGSTVQLAPPMPRGKLPILPYSRVKTADGHRGAPDCPLAEPALPGLRADAEKAVSLTATTNPSVADRVAAPPASRQNLGGNTFGPASRPELHHKAKLNGGPARRLGRKRKVAEDILAFQGKRRKGLLAKGRESKEKAKGGPQEPREHKAGAMRRYRSIMPKPVLVLPTLAPLAPPAALLPAPIPGRPGQAAQASHPLVPKHLPARPGAGHRNGLSWHRCHVCNHPFQFKRHLQDHMSTHTSRRLYRCRLCLKAYVRSGNLSAHMRLHHAEGRLKRLVCCEFCAKVFGHVRVYLGHLKEVHRVVISTEPASTEPQPGDPPRSRDASLRWPEGSMERENKWTLEDHLLNQADEVKLQIRCGRCQITAPSFADIKFHLLYVHGEEIQGRLQEAVPPGSRGAPAPEDPGKPAAPHWKHPEKRKPAKSPEEEAPALPKPKKQPALPPQNDRDVPTREAQAAPGPRAPGQDCQGLDRPSPRHQGLSSSLHCILCAQTWGQKEELLAHWGQQHKCKDPPRLWAILSTLCTQGGAGLSRDTEK